ncbi:hypothetical protein BuS5_02002 [Desulfosarcina sp. BuS5]|nr:hypothetical protein BuS5_02002 [Desulfosarcina sp. BuS5]
MEHRCTQINTDIDCHINNFTALYAYMLTDGKLTDFAYRCQPLSLTLED